jgi:type I restriction enzyme S subunit
MKYQRSRLGELCRIIRGTYPTLKTTPGPFPLVVTADFRRSADSWQLQGPAVCVPLISSTGHGDAALHRVHYQDGKFALANLLVALLPNDPAICDAKYLYHLLMARKDRLLVPLMLGTANVSLKEKDIAGVEIALPPLNEQWRIVARIEELAAKINEARGLRQKAAEEAEAFVTSFHAKLAGTRMKKLDEILRLDEDLVAVTPTGSYPQVGIKSFGAGLFAKSAVTGSDTTYKTFNRLYEGALILSQVKGWEGAVAICPATLAGWFVSPEYRTFRCVEDQARPGYLAPLVRTQWFWGKLGRATRGVGARRERTRPEQFMNIEIPIPTIEKQTQGERVFAQVDALKKRQTETAAELDALLPSILDKAFKGEL